MRMRVVMRGELTPVQASPSDEIARFEVGAGQPLTMTASVPQTALWPGAVIDVRLHWTGAWPRDASVFVHLRQDGANRAQQDGLPRYFVQESPGESVDMADLATDDCAGGCRAGDVASGGRAV